MKKFLVSIIIIISIVYLIPSAQADVFSEMANQLGDFNQKAGLPTGGSGSVVSIIINLINLVLSFLAVIFIIMILYGGFTYLTAGGSPDKAKKALGIIRDSAIGVGIILISGAIMNFVIVNIIDALK